MTLKKVYVNISYIIFLIIYYIKEVLALKFSLKFIKATDNFCTYEKHVPSPLFRKEFTLAGNVQSAEITICALGFYDLYINGTKITKGILAPYISNPDDIIYYDNYDIKPLLKEGGNAIGVQLGNGMQNAMGGSIWDFELARFRGAPRFALSFEAILDNGEGFEFEADESFKTHASPIWFDDLRCGTFYDARNEQNGYDTAGFDDSGWANAKIAETPRGETRLCEADSIKVISEVKPVSIKKAVLADYEPSHKADVMTEYKPQNKDGFLYDFGINTAGIVRLKIKGRKGQRIELQFCEFIDCDGHPSYANIYFYPDGYSQRDIYICKGEGEEIFEPQFTYHGYQYCQVMGIDEAQAAEDLLTMLVCNSDMTQRGGFECSDNVANKLQEMTIRSFLANFYYFPTDCPHREKNGWTGDASMSCEYANLNYSVEKNYTEWLRNIRKSQLESGALPGIIPTGGWGYHWGNGPCWDQVIATLPYYTYLYRGDNNIIKENWVAMLRYMNYASDRRNSDGLIEIGLGDWLPPGRGADHYKVPLTFTDTVCVINICEMSAFMFGEIGLTIQREFALKLKDELREAVRKNLIDFNSMTVMGRSQTGQAMAIFYNIFDEGEKEKAFGVLLDLIDEFDGHFDVGMQGLRALFHVLSDFGKGNLAYDMITRPDFPSYGTFIERGYTALPEDFIRDPKQRPNSLNHHFFGDISNWFITKVAGIRVNPKRTGADNIDIKPDFIEKLSYAKAHYDSIKGKTEASWKRENGEIILTVEAPEGIYGKIILPEGYVFRHAVQKLDGLNNLELKSGEYTVVPVRAYYKDIQNYS